MTDRTRRLLMLGWLALPVQAMARDRLDLSGFADLYFPDVQYSAVSPDDNVMDIYVPRGVTSPPLVIWVHGGAFWGGDKRDQDTLNRALPGLMAAGIAVASVNYRLSGTATWPAQRDDLAAVFGFVRDTAGDYGLDPGRVAVFGSSAGATLALVAGLDEAASRRGNLRAIAAWYPATLFTEMDTDMAQDGTEARGGLIARKGSMISRLVGTAVGVDAGPALAASPVTLLDQVAQDVALPPVLLAAGDKDDTISWRQSQRMAAALEARTTPGQVEFQLYPGSGHGSGAFKGRAVADLVAFVTRHLAA